MPEFTAGKWTAYEDCNLCTDMQYCVHCDKGDIARVFEAADAQLIANAPELYNTVYALLDYAYEALKRAGGKNETRGKAPRILRDIRESEELLARINEDIVSVH